MIEAMPDPDFLHVLVTRSAVAPDMLDLRNPAVEEQLRALYTPPRQAWVRMNMIGSLNGRVTGSDGTSDTLSNRADRRILTIIRKMSDAIVVGAETLRNERHLSTRPTWLCVVTSSGNLAGHRISTEDAAASVLVCCPPAARAEVERTLPGAHIHHLESQDGKLPLDGVLTALRDRGLHQIVVEGGNRLISQFLDQGKLDEICLTQAPVFAPNEATSLPGSIAGTKFERELLLEDSAQFLYQRLVTNSPRQSATA
ncbi:dihydrofolate reductase family protein [Gulosibacter chungangensis]|uniref:dihydrofolate reductase family protein n=1 Tax=Gulosibacter chungangensis TaxID=979746 RepID=UPI001CE413B8|nr:dihydrofolate reductase family protein [Gulosibacter chungangensis]